MKKFQQKQNKKVQQSKANSMLERNKLKHVHNYVTERLYYGVGEKDGKNVFVGEVKAKTESEAYATLQELATKGEVKNLKVQIFKNHTYGQKYNNY